MLFRSHKNSVYKGTPRECVGCHQTDYNNTRSPNHAAAGYATTCESCHRPTDPSWTGGAFNHASVFALVGVHATQTCTACHKNNVYKGTPRDCVGCHLADYNGAIGLPIPSTEVAIRDDDGRDVALGQSGELCVRGPQVMAGYWQRPDETAKVMTADGFFRTGDVGMVDERGYFRIVDRKKDMILVSDRKSTRLNSSH